MTESARTHDEVVVGQIPIGPTERAHDDSDHWAKLVRKLHITTEIPSDAINLNVEGRQVTAPMQGFGKLWQKTYRIDVGAEVTPTQVVADWKHNFSRFWPEGNRFYGSVEDITPGDVALINLSIPGRLKVSTGILVIYADDESFTFITPEGHQWAGFNTFSAFTDPRGHTIAQVQALIRTNDPMWELFWPVATRMEDRFWGHTLRALAAHFGVENDPEKTAVCIDRKRQWRNAKNIYYNAAIRSTIYIVLAPVRWMGRRLRVRSRAA